MGSILLVTLYCVVSISISGTVGKLKVVQDEAMHMDGLFEGDIYLGKNKKIEQVADAVYEAGPDVKPVDPSRVLNNAIRFDRDPRARWPNNQIPYALSRRYSSREKQTILDAMEAFHKETCIQFTPAQDSDRDYIFIGKGDGCYSMVGRVGGRQDLSLDDGCVYKGTAMHELMHTVGFFHEQSRSDRDDYITVVWDNISRRNWGQFRKLSLREIDLLNTEYDYNSIMHYKSHAFTTNGRPTIIVKKKGASIGNRRYFSDTDITKINRLYGCDKSNRGRVTARPPVTRRPSSRTGGSTSCRDESNRCNEVATLTLCRTNRQVRSKCQRTCNLCSGGSTSSTGSSGGGSRTCQDKVNDCDRYKSMLSDGCGLGLMQKYCAGTCGVCGRG